MTDYASDLLRTLSDRGYIHQVTDATALDALDDDRVERFGEDTHACAKWLVQHLPQVRVGFELGSTEAIKRVVAESDALGCLSRYAVMQSVADGHLVELRTRLPKASRKFAIALHREKRLGRASTDFLAHCNAAEPKSTG